ncbi:membrane protein [hydrothermal vent metagenome]|uniref:Membrane protein n=1 Tax=hydrothermal vent metagenome TaxID=652676 RepID=A0A1W1EE77_9ZZZZ
MNKYFKITTMFYLVLLGATLGAGLYAGAVVAPVTFHTERWLSGEILSNYQEGIIMTQNFLRLSYLVTFTLVIVALYEGYKYKKFERDTITQVATFFVLATGLLFTQYYIPDILHMQMAGEEMTKTVAFLNTHKGSEINFKIFSLALLVLLVRNMQKACK